MDFQLSAAGRPDENLLAEVIGPFWFSKEEMVKNRRSLYFSLQKGQIRANIFYQPQISANLEVLQFFFPFHFAILEIPFIGFSCHFI